LRVATNEPRKHHYVPVFYQKHFTDNEGLLWVYDRRLSTYKRLHPLVVCCEKDFYTIFSKNGRHLRLIETQFTAPLDTAADKALKELSSRRHLDSVALQEIALFVGLQRARVPAFRRAVSALVKATLEEFLRIGFTDVGRAAQLIANYEKGTGLTLGQKPEALVDVARSGAITVEATETAFLEQMVGQVQTISELASRFRWRILEAPRTTGFITCDDPLVTVPSSICSEGDVGMAIPGSKTYFPLARRLCLELRPTNHSVGFRQIGANATRQINKNIAANSDRFIIGPNQVQLEHVVKKSGSTNTEPDRVQVDIVRRDNDSGLLKMSTHRRRYFYY
jgi:Protein of unknown function (DUF4238)